MSKRALLLFWLLGMLSLHAQGITLAEINSKPPSRARDFLIWEFLRQENVDENAAKAAYALAKNKSNYKIKKAYAKIVDDEIRKEFECKKKKDLLTIKDDVCLRAAFSLKKTSHYSRFERDRLLARGLSSWQKELLALQNEPYSFERYRYHKPKSVISYLSSMPKKMLHTKLNKKLDADLLSFLQKASNFGLFVSLVVTDYKLNKLQESLLDVESDRLNAYTNFLLGLNALRHNKKEQAIKYLQLARKKAKSPTQRDKADFWLYLVTKDQSYLKTLLLSMSINIYTLYAHEKMHVDVENYFVHLNVKSTPSSSYNLQDPFDWLAILKDIESAKGTNLFELVKRYRSKDLIPVQRYVIERAFDFKMHGYIMPYDAYMKDLSNDDKALIYAIMRRESSYIPSALSRSFALGLMQLMPFLVDHIAKKKGERIKSYSEMFNPAKNLEYARIHLKWLKKVLHDNPLFIAYAYNGGYGFFRSYKKSGHFKKGAYEPFLSMELMRNSESREYGKYVLANYAMYKKIYKEPFSLISFFETLK